MLRSTCTLTHRSGSELSYSSFTTKCKQETDWSDPTYACTSPNSVVVYASHCEMVPNCLLAFKKSRVRAINEVTTQEITCQSHQWSNHAVTTQGVCEGSLTNHIFLVKCCNIQTNAVPHTYKATTIKYNTMPTHSQKHVLSSKWSDYIVRLTWPTVETTYWALYTKHLVCSGSMGRDLTRHTCWPRILAKSLNTMMPRAGISALLPWPNITTKLLPLSVTTSLYDQIITI